VSYRVVWDEKATENLQRIYDEADDREAIVHAIHRIGLELGSNPLGVGESRDRGRRVLFKHPLMVQYRIKARFNEILIFDVRLVRH
jgi:hypothetical protein